MRTLKIFARDNGWSYSENYEGSIIQNDEIIATVSKYPREGYSMLIQHVDAVPCTNSPLMSIVKANSQKEIIDAVEYWINVELPEVMK